MTCIRNSGSTGTSGKKPVVVDEEAVKIMDMFKNGREAEAKELMIKKISGFIGDVINNRFSNFKKNGMYHDLFNEGCVAVLAKMPNYDPYKSAPTTFFEPYIRQALCKYVGMLVNHSSPYHSEIMNKVRRAINYYETTQKTEYTITDLSLYTGLSVNKVQAALDRISYTSEVMCGTNEDFDVVIRTRQESPESAYLKKEMTKYVADALCRLDELDRNILVDKLGLDENYTPGSSRKTPGMGYAAIASKYRIPINQVRESYQKSMRRLAHDPSLKQYNYGRNTKKCNRAKKSVELVYTDSSYFEELYESLDRTGSGVSGTSGNPAAQEKMAEEEPFILKF